ncbi:MAG: FtsX-like permease family protein [Halanaerobiales bacterium]
MFLARIALRNLFRQKRRTYVTASVLAIAILIYLVSDSLMAGISEIAFKNIINFESSHLLFSVEDFYEENLNNKLDYTFIPPDTFERKIKNLSKYTGMTSLIDFSAKLSNAQEEFPVTVRAIEVDSYQKVFSTANYLIAGEFISPGENSLVIGKELANIMNLEVGDFYTLLFKNSNGTLNTIEGIVKGIVLTPHPDINLFTVFLPIDQLANSVALEEGEINKVFVRLDDRKDSSRTADKVSFEDSGLITRTWEDAAEMVIALRELGKKESIIILGLILVIGAIGVVNIIALSALERIKEIGTMKAMGLEESEIVKVFAIEAAGVGLIGSIFASSLGILIIGFLSRFGININSLGGIENSFGIPVMGRIYGIWNLHTFFFLCLFSIILSILASIIPALCAAKKDPIKAIYHK